MAITKGAKKAHRASLNKALFNDRRRRVMKSTVKDVKVLVEKKDKKAAEKDLSLAYKALDKAAKTGLIKKNTASRKKSRLAAAIKKIK